jgi:hypothetical protein
MGIMKKISTFFQGDAKINKISEETGKRKSVNPPLAGFKMKKRNNKK